MSLTAQVKQELVRVHDNRESARRAEVATIIRYAGTLQPMSHRLVIEVEVENADIAHRLSDELVSLFGAKPEIHQIGTGSGRSGNKHVLRILEKGTDIVRLLGLVDGRGFPVKGLPPALVRGALHDAQAVWRGAFLAHGSLTEPGRSAALEITAPSTEAAMALVGAARRLDVTAKAREARGSDRVMIRDGEAISTLLGVIGAPETRAAWDDSRSRLEVRATANRLANFDDANLRRSARAAVAAAARVERALEILGEDVPDHLLTAGELRTTHRQSSLEELGQLASPPMTKDAIAGRIRRLLSMADRKAADLGIPDTDSAVTEELLDEE